MRGTIKTLKIGTIGGVVQPGAIWSRSCRSRTRCWSRPRSGRPYRLPRSRAACHGQGHRLRFLDLWRPQGRRGGDQRRHDRQRAARELLSGPRSTDRDYPGTEASRSDHPRHDRPGRRAHRRENGAGLPAQADPEGPQPGIDRALTTTRVAQGRRTAGRPIREKALALHPVEENQQCRPERDRLHRADRFRQRRTAPAPCGTAAQQRLQPAGGGDDGLAPVREQIVDEQLRQHRMARRLGDRHHPRHQKRVVAAAARSRSAHRPAGGHGIGAQHVVADQHSPRSIASRITPRSAAAARPARPRRSSDARTGSRGPEFLGSEQVADAAARRRRRSRHGHGSDRAGPAAGEADRAANAEPRFGRPASGHRR